MFNKKVFNKKVLSKTIKSGFALAVSVLVISGCATSSDTTDTNPTPIAPQPAVVTASEPTTTSSVQSSVVSLGTIFYFEFDQATLTAGIRDLLTAHANELQVNPRNIRLEGHADERGTREYNMALGERRANAVRDYLRSQGVNSLIEVISYGEEQPADVVSSENAWSLNRRVELK
ncbi:MAG: peptidoglycan-associated lipoprotein [Cellvibrionaceae bacterium]|jgi:peptidoglycan-associated lipoprotein